MEVLHTFKAARRWAAGRGVGAAHAGRLGLVPTMGALHAGHLAHVPALRRRGADSVAVSIFVNPTQFGPGEDLDRYPRPLEADLTACRDAGVDAVFHPDADEVYPPAQTATPLTLDVPALTGVLEGTDRPGHFAGVCRVVAKLLIGLMPDLASFGEKDFQQLAVVRAMTMDLGLPVELLPVPIVREPDGLARSSRNLYLTPVQRASATALVRALGTARAAFANGQRNPGVLERHMAAVLDAAAGVDPVYAVIRDPGTLGPVAEAGPHTRALIAARLGTTRLIDNAALGG